LSLLPTIVFRAEFHPPPEPASDSEAQAQAQAQKEFEAEQFRRAQSGCPEAFSALVDAYGPRILRYLGRWTGNDHDAEDLTQETFLKAYRNLKHCAHARAVGGWLFTIARRTALNFHRARRSRPSHCVELDSELAEPARSNPVADADDRVWELARGLAPAHYEVLWLSYAEGLSVAEVARVMGCSAINVRVRLHRARHLLRRRLELDQRGNNSEESESRKQSNRVFL
jgi:RNA polymerase sigma-70 factor (ECF subfamily)